VEVVQVSLQFKFMVVAEEVLVDTQSIFLLHLPLHILILLAVVAVVVMQEMELAAVLEVRVLS
jgi:hypothetical protein